MVQRIISIFALSLGCLLLSKAHTATSVLALASSARTSPRKKSPKRNKGTTAAAARNRSKGGFSSVPPPNDSDDDASDENAKQTVRNLFSVCSHIQNPELYQPHWADNASRQIITNGKKNAAVVASKNIAKGGVLTLFPIHALGLRTLRRNSDARKKKKHRRDDTEFVAYDLDRDGEYFTEDNQRAGLRMKLNIPLEEGQPASSAILSGHSQRKNKVLFAMLFREDESLPGWLGGHVRSSLSAASMEDAGGTSAAAAAASVNCMTIPLPGSAPLCAVVATRDVEEGEELVRGNIDAKVVEECKTILSREYEAELAELRSYIEMACSKTINERDTVTEGATQQQQPDEEEEELNVGVNLGPFHQINQQYPNLKLLHRNPDIYQVDNFLSSDECDRIIAKATPHLKPCITKNESTGAIEANPSRTSTDANLPQSEAPTVVSKLTDLANCDANRLEIFQVLRYTRGQEFRPHTDGYDGATSACGFEESNRLATVFCYLKDVERGGSTYFPKVDVEIRPRKGMAVVHFPSDVELREDERTLHQGMEAIDEKMLLTTWVWDKPRSKGVYDEANLPPLSSDVI